MARIITSNTDMYQYDLRPSIDNCNFSETSRIFSSWTRLISGCLNVQRVNVNHNNNNVFSITTLIPNNNTTFHGVKCKRLWTLIYVLIHYFPIAVFWIVILYDYIILTYSSGPWESGSFIMFTIKSELSNKRQ